MHVSRKRNRKGKIKKAEPSSFPPLSLTSHIFYKLFISISFTVIGEDLKHCSPNKAASWATDSVIDSVRKSSGGPSHVAESIPVLLRPKCHMKSRYFYLMATQGINCERRLMILTELVLLQPRVKTKSSVLKEQSAHYFTLLLLHTPLKHSCRCTLRACFFGSYDTAMHAGQP